MKLVKNFALAVTLAFFFAVSAPAGEVPMPGKAGATPSPTPATSTTDETKSSIYSEPIASDLTVETSDYLFFEALAALLSVY